MGHPRHGLPSQASHAMRKALRILTRLLIVLLLLSLLAVGVAWWLARGSLATLDGERSLQGLSAPVVVTRDALETLLWADELPDGDALRSHMYKLRQAIDRPFDSPLIHTVHRIGYRVAEDAR